MMEEIAEAVGLKNHLIAHCASPEVAREVAVTYDKTMEFCQRLGQYSISPGNFAGGLTTIEEKSLGAVCKAGDCAIQGVLKIAQAPPRPGFWLLDVIPDDRVEPAFFGGGDATGLIDQVASGCHLLLLITGRGHTGGVPVSPVIKLTGNERTFSRMASDIDFSAAGLLTGELSMPEAKDALARLILSVAGSAKSNAERVGHAEGTLFFNHQQPDRVCWTRYD
jgi:altronate hydrolase